MKKKIYLLSITLASTAVLFLSSCLKDNTHLTDFSKSGTFVDFPLGGLTNFSTDAVTAAPDSASGLIKITFAVNIASVNVPTTATVVNLAVNDPADVAALNKAQTAVTYLIMPANAYTISSKTVTIPANQQYAELSVSFNKALLDPALSYVLPVRIVSGTGAKLTANLNVHYYHFIGNDFAGIYKEKYQRYNAADSTSAALNGASFDFTDGVTATFQPVSPSEFTVYSGYVSGAEFRYDVTFTKTGSGASASYSNFHVAFIPSDVAAQLPSITVLQKPVFFDPVTHKPGSADLPGPYTFAQALTIFHFQWEPMTSAPRYILDTYKK